MNPKFIVCLAEAPGSFARMLKRQYADALVYASSLSWREVDQKECNHEGIMTVTANIAGQTAPNC